MSTDLKNYMSGFGNEFATEALEGALPLGKNSPQKAPYGLYPEQFTGSPFTMPINSNFRSWFYRIKPSVMHTSFEPLPHDTLLAPPFNDEAISPNQMRWDPFPTPGTPQDFLDSLFTIAGNGDLYHWSGLAIHMYAANKNMDGRYFYNSDGEFMVVPQDGDITFRTEFGTIEASPGEIVVIPRGVKFTVDLPDGKARGYVCENFGQPFVIPDRGPIGANGLANQRDFLYPVAAYEDLDGDFKLISKFAGNLWQAPINHSPLNVVAWHGNYAPYKYDLSNFNTINTVSFDHPDPSIFTVMTSPSSPAGTANIDFVIFPPRWMVAEDTFRPPYFHRNIMSEFMGLILGVYDGKEGGGFNPGGYSLHNCMSAHGPDAAVVKKATEAELKPQYIDGTLAFMFESRFILKPTKQALEMATLQDNYHDCWQNIPKMFDENSK